MARGSKSNYYIGQTVFLKGKRMSTHSGARDSLFALWMKGDCSQLLLGRGRPCSLCGVGGGEDSQLL